MCSGGGLGFACSAVEGKGNNISGFRNYHMTVRVASKNIDPLQGSHQLENSLVCWEGIEGFIMALRTVDGSINMLTLSTPLVCLCLLGYRE